KKFSGAAKKTFTSKVPKIITLPNNFEGDTALEVIIFDTRPGDAPIKFITFERVREIFIKKSIRKEKRRYRVFPTS
ncbi:hypothetical protein QR685DRAFT_435010, partial [Neurospora intermedia]